MTSIRTIAAVLAASTALIAGAIASAGAVIPSAAAPPATIDPALAAAIADAPDAPLLVFVHGRSIDDAVTGTAAAGLRLVDTFPRIGIAVATADAEQVGAVASEPGITFVEDATTPLEYELDTSHVATRGAEVIAGFSATDALGAVESHQYDGAGVTVAVVDSGIDASHPFFQRSDGTSKVVRNLEFVCHDVLTIVAGDDGLQDCLVDGPPDTDTNGAGGHGTHVAGIVGGVPTDLADGRRIMGAAPGADLVGISAGAGISMFGTTSAMYWVLENHENPCDGCHPIKVVNNSWGSAFPGDFSPNSANAKVTDALIEAGVTVVYAAGNDGGDGSANLVNPEAQNPTPGVIGVANYDDLGTGSRDGALDSTSSRGEDGRVVTYPDVSAPGAHIVSSCRIHLPVCQEHLELEPDDDFDYAGLSGTSMAAPHVAGIVAQLYEAHPALTPAEVEDALEDTARKFAFGAPYEADLADRNADGTTSFDKGHGLVDVMAAVERVLSITGPEPPAVCSPDAPVIVDAQGDATALLGQDTPRESEPSLDVIRGDIDELGDGSLSFTITVDELTEAPPSAGVGEYFDWNFTFEGANYYLTMYWDHTTGEKRFLLGFLDTTGRTTLTELSGTVDVEADTFATVLHPTAFSENLEGAPEITEGTVFGGHEIVSRYDQVFLVPDVDHAPGACPYTVGLGAVPPPAEDPEDPTGGLPDGDADGVITETDPTVTFTAAPGTAVNEHTIGVGVGVTAPTEDVYTVDIHPAATGSTATFETVTEVGELNDIDVYVYDQDGNVVGQGASEGGFETDTWDVAEVERYTIKVYRYATVEAGYELTVSIG